MMLDWRDIWAEGERDEVEFLLECWEKRDINRAFWCTVKACLSDLDWT